tara:strand:- start:16957 stop:18396 length:1440 start_codon:yes stop_codon:yes gene_type:complete
MLNEKDLVFLSSQGITKDSVDNQIDFLTGNSSPKTLTLIRPCTQNDGILSPSEIKRINSESNPPMPGVFISRFIPSSGSGTRMFNFDKFSKEFFSQLHLLPFFSEIEECCLSNDIDLEEIIKNKDVDKLEKILLDANFMNLSSEPKALINFHKIGKSSISPFEQFLLNSLDDITNDKIYFSVQDGLNNKFDSKIKESIFFQNQNLEINYDLIPQLKSTNSICLDMDNNLIREKNGDIYTHPSGHGALLEGLNNIDADFIFINNIDNISPKTRELRFQVSMALYNIAFNTKKNFDMMIQTFTERNYSLLEPSINQLEHILPSQLKGKTIEEKVDLVLEMLNKPIRVCGVIKDENSKGGKPFWVYDGNSESVQIVEESQVDFNDEKQRKVWESNIYFNPVEMVCCTKDFQGNKFNLKNFSEDLLKMKVKREISGRDCQFIELPGLWNGSMHYWHTTFVEIPSSLFTPVKNFTDLFLPIHQP